MDWLGQLSPYSAFARRTLGWWFLPGIATRTALTAYYNALAPIGLGHRIPPANSPKRVEHYRRTFALVVLGYLSWTLVQNLLEQPPSFYSLLGVNVDASDGEIKTAYRNFAKRYHPDKVGPAGEALFTQVRDAYEALKHPIKRYGYDRFGFEALEWKVAENPHAMLWQGLENALRYYMPTGLVMMVMAITGWGGTSTYWRHLAWALVATLEACIIIGYNPLAPYANILGPLLSQLTQPVSVVAPGLSLIPSMAPYQWTFFLRETFVSLAVAIGVVVPVVFPPPPTKKEEQARQAEIARLAIGLDPVVRDIIVQSAMSDMQARELVLKEVQYLDIPHPLPALPTDLHISDAHREALNSLAPALQRLVVHQTLLNDPNLRASFLEALGRTAVRLKQEDQDARGLAEHVTYAGIGRDQLTPAPDLSRNMSSAPEDAAAARILAIPSPPSSIFALSREVTPEPSHARTFDPNIPGFSYRSSPGGGTPTYRAQSMSENRSPSFLVSSPAAGRMRRPSLSPHKRPSTLSEVGLVSPTSPIMVKQELA